MTNRWIRFLLAVLAIAAAAGAAYRIVQDEQALARELSASRHAAQSADAALVAIDDLKATLYAYVAPGQDADFWTARTGLLLDKLRGALLELDGAATASGSSLGDALDISDRLAAAERRAQGYVRTAQPLLAAEIIFREARDLIDALRITIARTRDELTAASAARQTELRREQMYLVGGATGVLAMVMLLLVPTGTPPPRAQPAPTGLSLERRTAAAIRVDAAEPVDGIVSPARRAAANSATRPPEQKPLVQVRPSPARSAPDFAAVAGLCRDLATVTASVQMEQVLERARTLLNARGVIVWSSTADREALQPVAAAGYDARVLSRLGSIRRDAENLTAGAFREDIVRSSTASGTTPAALAVPLPSPHGPSGVFSAELAPGGRPDEPTLAAARLIAAQLGTLLGIAVTKSPDAEDAPSASAAAAQLSS